MDNWKVTDKYNMTCVVLAHNAEHAILRAYKMYFIRGVKAESSQIFLKTC